MPIELRPIAVDEFVTFHRAAGAGFGNQPSEEDTALQREGFEFDRSLVAIEDDRFVGTGEIFSFELTLPGATSVPAGGVSWITVLPTHRRRGILTSIMRRQLSDIRERGELVALLYASESVIYGRFGFGVATASVAYEVDTRHGAFLHAPEITGRVKLLEKQEAAQVIPNVYERFRLSQPGALTRNQATWDYWFTDPERWHEGSSARFYAVYESVSGEIEGYAPYRIRSKWEGGFPASTLQFMTMVAFNSVARTALWQYALNVDLVRIVEANDFPPDEPVRWMLADYRRLQAKSTHDGLYVRVVDIPAALQARSYATTDCLVFRVTDLFCPENAGCYELDASPAGATCRKTSADPDLSLDITDLGSVYLGGVRFTTLGKATRIVEHTPGALLRADLMFWSGVVPWCTFGF